MDLVDWAGDALRVALGAIFLWLGYFDVRASPARKEEFRRWGFPSWTQPTGGILQLLSVGLLVLPQTVLYAAVILVAMMVFSVYVHLAREFRPRAVPWPAFLGVLSLAVGFLYGEMAWGPAGALFRAIFPHG
jgi:DoxX-like family